MLRVIALHKLAGGGNNWIQAVPEQVFDHRGELRRPFLQRLYIIDSTILATTKLRGFDIKQG